MPKEKQTPKEKVCLICIDGWGVSPDENPKGDAIRNANTPVMDKFKETYPYTEIAAHGLSVGLPDGLMGNSEVGHLNIGAGRVVYQVSQTIHLRPLRVDREITRLFSVCPKPADTDLVHHR